MEIENNFDKTTQYVCDCVCVPVCIGVALLFRSTVMVTLLFFALLTFQCFTFSAICNDLFLCFSVLMLYIIDELLYFNFSVLLIFTACHLQKFSCLISAFIIFY